MSHPPPTDGSTTPAPDARSWFYSVGAAQLGPIDSSVFAAAIRAGVIRRETPVWTAGMEQWLPAVRLPHLAGDLAIGADVIPTAPPIAPGAIASSTPSPYPAGMEWVLPVGRSTHALIAGYLGLFSLLGFFAPFAVIFGVLALGEIRKNPSLRGRGRAWFGLIMGTLCSLAVVAALIAAAL